jgi:hypothetical protein
MPFMKKVTLWAGPQDGLEVQVGPDAIDYHIPGPPKLTPGNVINPRPTPQDEMLVGVYTLNPITDRFEWVGYS